MAASTENEQGEVSDEFEVVVTGPGLEMTRKVGQRQALQVMAVILGGAQIPIIGPAEQGGPGGSGGRGGPPVAVSEFLEGLAVSNNPERIAAILLYLREYHDLSVVAKEELPGWFKRAGEAAPKNLSRDLRNAIKASLIAEDPSDADQYFITGTGAKKLRGNSSE